MCLSCTVSCSHCLLLCAVASVSRASSSFCEEVNSGGSSEREINIVSVGIIRVDVFELGEADFAVVILVELFDDDIKRDCAALAPLVTNVFSVFSRLLQSAFFDASTFVTFLDFNAVQC